MSEDQAEQRDLLARIGDWAEATFGATGDGSRLTHIARELDELRAHPDDGEEMADIVILLCHQAKRHGVDLFAAIARKHSINQQRTWLPPDAEGVIEHVRGATS